MIKRLLCIATLLSLVFSFASCKSKDDGKNATKRVEDMSYSYKSGEVITLQSETMPKW